MKIVNVRETPIALKDITTVMPVYTHPFLPAVEEKYLTSIEVVQDNDVKVVLNGAEWIHPDGCSMGRVDISTNTYMVAMNRIASLTVVTNKKKTVMAGVVISLTDGGAYLLTEGVEKTKDE